MIQAIMYTSNTGFTARYAHMLGEKTGLPVCSLGDAGGVPAGGQIIYMGWLMAGGVKGYKKAAKRWKVACVCGVGMAATGSQLDDVRRANALPPEMPVFTLQGGYDRSKLRGLYKLAMTIMGKTLGGKLEKKPDRTPDEEDMLAMMREGGDRVSEENLRAVLAWYQGAQDTAK